ncbi:hypothetical protein [Cerasicoccus arenae]|uniref:Uncharacterized protein n=1 Tax=Cerasicoccus arenae TaxID=424488 RepID=A0A8J3DD06_9BACT|nr:hypothetical protein [Cerasicoccus arenae]GHB91284.1 hypothetical protein GCM10007047_02920 [Cerasicoccus arenae]
MNQVDYLGLNVIKYNERPDGGFDVVWTDRLFRIPHGDTKLGVLRPDGWVELEGGNITTVVAP